MTVPVPFTRALLALCLLAINQSVFAQEAICGSLRNHFGPFDYRTARPEDIENVESNHFTPRVENLQGGNKTVTPGGDMAYTLHVFPNHPRALMSLIKFAERKKKTHLPEMKYSVPCYFERAERFKPDDAWVKTLHGVYLLRSGKFQEAKEKLEAALELAGDNANIYYNLGLAYFDLKDYDKALNAAHHAYTLKFPLPGLRDKLQRAGKWRDPVPQANAAAGQTESPQGDASAEQPTRH